MPTLTLLARLLRPARRPRLRRADWYRFAGLHFPILSLNGSYEEQREKEWQEEAHNAHFSSRLYEQAWGFLRRPELPTKHLFLALHWLRLPRACSHGGTKMCEKNPKRLNTVLFLLIAGSLCWPAAASAQFHPKDTEWPSYGRRSCGHSLSPLARSTLPISAIWKLPGASRPTISAPPEYKLEARAHVERCFVRHCGIGRGDRAGPATGELLWITASMKENAEAPSPAAFRPRPRIGPMARKSESFM